VKILIDTNRDFLCFRQSTHPNGFPKSEGFKFSL
jgi:hypothetical protein